MARKKVTIIGAGMTGGAMAQRLIERNIADVVLQDDPQFAGTMHFGKALDESQAAAWEGYSSRISATDGWDETADSDVIVCTAGAPRKPGMTREELLNGNAAIVRAKVSEAAKHSPNAVIIVVSNPLDEMTALAQIATGFPKNRVIGQAGMLDTARFTNFVAEKLGVAVSSVKTLTLGSHGDTMVPVPSRCTVDGVALSEKLSAAEIEDLVTKTRNGGAEIVALLKTGSAYYAPSAAAARMAKAVIEDSGAIMPVCAWVDGEYGISGVYLGVEAELGRTGIRKVVETKLSDSELTELKAAAEAVRAKQADVQSL